MTLLELALQKFQEAQNFLDEDKDPHVINIYDFEENDWIVYELDEKHALLLPQMYSEPNKTVLASDSCWKKLIELISKADIDEIVK